MQDLIKPLITTNDTKIILLVLDGLGGLPRPDGPDAGKTELEAADTPNLDALARASACGLHTPVEMAITPGSGPGHLGIFGYDPIQHQIGRGLLEALGLGVEIAKTDVAVRCNYSTIKDGVIVDRRAGRIPTEQSRELTLGLQEKIKKIDDAEIFFAPGMEHRFAVRMRFPEPLSPGAASINDTDPQKEGKPPLAPQAMAPEAQKVVEVAKKFIEAVSAELKGQEKANYALMRGFSERPPMPSFQEAFGLRSLAIAPYPMYRGVARLVGMDAPDLGGDIKEELDFLRENYDKYDFFFVHIKKVDSYGEDGNFDAKAAKIAEVDRAIPEFLALKPDVLIITGDHSTPALLASHSWHPVPVILHSPYVLGGLSAAFSERECMRGELGVFPSVKLIPMALANSGRLKKFGA